jgi:hypothetical protein
MAITPSEFKERFEEFASTSDSRIQIFIDKALLNIGEGEWGAYFTEGQLYLTAHFLALANQTQNSGGEPVTGVVSSRKIGDVSVTFMVPTALQGDVATFFYNQTAYGQEYYRLMRIVGEGMAAIV